MIETFDSAKFKSLTFLFGLLLIFAQTFSVQIEAQTPRKAAARTAKKKVVAKRQQPSENNEKGLSSIVKVTQIDEIALKGLINRDGESAKPLLINFWATWCDPCREEFPDLVKIGADYKDKIDLITISLDELSEINGDVPKFLAEMKAEMPSYLLKTSSEEAAIAVVSKEWQGGLPFTILFNEKGESVYFKQGKFNTAFLRTEIEKIIEKQAKDVTDKDIRIKLVIRRDIEESEIPYQKER